MRDELIAELCNYCERLARFTGRNFDDGGIETRRGQRASRDFSEARRDGCVGHHRDALANFGRVTPDETAQFGQKSAADDHLVALAAGNYRDGGGGRHMSGMRNARRERKLDFRTGIRGRYPHIPTTMPDEPTQPSSPAPETSSGLAPNVGAGLACVFPLIAGIIFLVIEKKNEFIRFWAAQAVVFGGALTIGSIVIQILSVILTTIHLGFIATIISLLWMLVCLAALVVWVIMLIKSFSGQKWEIPVVSNYVPMVLGWFKT
jgi:uncharacterized membrane protein